MSKLEILNALKDGKKIGNTGLFNNYHIYLDNGVLMDNFGNRLKKLPTYLTFGERWYIVELQIA